MAELTDTEKKILRLFLSADATTVDTVHFPKLSLVDEEIAAFQDFETRGLVRQIDTKLWGLTLEGMTMAAKLMKPWRKLVFVTEYFAHGDPVAGVDGDSFSALETMRAAVPDKAKDCLLLKLSDGSVAISLTPSTRAPAAIPGSKRRMSLIDAPCGAQAALQLRQAELQRHALDLKIGELREKVLQRRSGE